ACVVALNELLRGEAVLYEKQFEPGGFEWVDLSHRAESVIVYRRKGAAADNDLLIILNMTPVARMDWEITLTGKQFAGEIYNSDNERFGGSGKVFNPDIRVKKEEDRELTYTLLVNLPPLAGIILK
ncbi:MAG TPA: alpha amylase C-terminal domain-containing protein, partial [Chitinophagaceae bacterium]|nr:alpha amylase C-terminal domain-containing protein [Chitinophagaceae bacterium]